MLEYLSFITTKYDALHVVGDKIDEQNLMQITLSELGPNYRSFITKITNRLDHITLADLQGLLLNEGDLNPQSLEIGLS